MTVTRTIKPKVEAVTERVMVCDVCLNDIPKISPYEGNWNSHHGCFVKIYYTDGVRGAIEDTRHTCDICPDCMRFEGVKDAVKEMVETIFQLKNNI